MNLARRSLLKFAGGAAAGAFLTPAPWKLVSDSALWSQNWSWIPKLPVGERKIKRTACTLCPVGCGMEARCVGDQPVSLVGIAGHPVSNGSLCALGLAAHHLPYHSRRASFPYARNAQGKHVPVALDDAMGQIRKAIDGRAKGETVAILDERPGRTLSLVYRRFLGGIQDGVYLTPPERETATLSMLAGMTGEAGRRLGVNFTSTRAVLSFGAPILDGWGIPAQVNAARYRRESPMKLVQVETRQSRSASLADVWLPARPGSETAVALGLAHVLIAENLVPAGIFEHASDAAAYKTLVAQFTPEKVSAICGVPPETLVSTARLLAANTPAVAIGGGDPGGGPAARAEELAVAGLNLMLGAMGAPGGIEAREEPPVPDAWRAWKLGVSRRLDEVADHSIAVLILGDAPSGDALPWPLIARKLVAGKSVVVSLAPYVEGPARHANFLMPAPAFLETLEEIPTPPTSTGASLAVAAPLLKPPAGAVEPVDFLHRLGGDQTSLADLVKERVASLTHGEFLDGNGKKADGDGWKTLVEGGIWMAKSKPVTRPARFAMLGAGEGETVRAAAMHGAKEESGFPLVLMPYAWRGASGSAVLPPLLTKVYQESRLRASASQCRLHPSTANQFEIRDGDQVALETNCGTCVQQAWVDASVMPGVLEVPAGPNGTLSEANVLDVCGPDQDCTWRASRARIRRMA